MTLRVNGPRRWAVIAVAAAMVLTGCSSHSAADDADVSRSFADVATTTSATPTPTPTPTTVVTTVTEEIAVAFGATTVEDPNRDVGTSAVTTTGSNGVTTRTWHVTTVDGVETGRELVSEAVTTAPVDQVTSVGTRQPPPPPPAAAPPAAAPAAPSGCDPNYDGCVPVASDVDCAGGSGNGPAYVQGPVRVIGQDVYDLDRDGDGIGCDS